MASKSTGHDKAVSPSSCLQWQHRSQQIKQLQLLLKRSYVPDLLIFGPSCTGKTSIVRELVAGRQHAYISCSKFLKLRGLLSSAVAQLSQNGKRKRSNAYAGAAGTENSLIWELKALCPVDQPSRVIVLDDMQQLLSASDGPLAPLLALRSQAGVNISLVMISRAQPAALGLSALLPGLVTVSFPAYKDIELVNIVVAAGPPATSPPPNSQPQQQQQQQQMYRAFISQRLVKDFKAFSRYLPDLASQAATLWPRYLAAARLAAQQQQQQDTDMEAQQGDADVDQESRIFGAIKHRLESSLAAFQPAACVTLAALNTTSSQQQQQQRVGLSGAHMAAGMEMCRMTKLLLIAGFLASRNKSSVDKQLFEDGVGGWRKRGGRRKNVMGADRQAEAAKAAELKGPHTFSLSRLLQVYSNLLRADENYSSSSSSSSHAQQQQQQQLQQDKLAAAGGWMGVQTADVMMGVNSLVAARLMTKACDDVLEAPRFGCEAPQDFVQQVAVDMGVPLSSYLKYV